MSEYINNKEHRQNTIKDILKQLHSGKSVDEVKKQFEEVFDGVSASEISEAESALIKEGMAVEEVQKLCDVHASVVGGSIEGIHSSKDASDIPGHPTNTIKLENEEIRKIIGHDIRQHLWDMKNKKDKILAGITNLEKINLHYQAKETLIFPMMEKHDITAPPKVMWGVDDEIRALIKKAKAAFSNDELNDTDAKTSLNEAIEKIEEMIFKEETIMIPMLLENLSDEEWKTVADGYRELGYIIDEVANWVPENISSPEESSAPVEGVIKLPSGLFKIDELTAFLNTLPFDITFVDAKDQVSYFSEGKDRVFPRARAIIGRNVSNCHPPASVHIVEGIVADFKSGKKDQEDFWINMGGKFILIRYYAVRSPEGEYLGVLEVTQDIKPIQEITGEKRLVSE